MSQINNNIACECDYDGVGDPLEYVKCSRYCPLHDHCTCCVDNLGKHKVEKEWLCDECNEMEAA